MRKSGCSVLVVNAEIDILAGYGGVTMAAEIKDGSKPPSKQKLTPAEQKFHDNWKGGIYLIRNVDDAMNMVETMRMNAGILSRQTLQKKLDKTRIKSCNINQ